MQQPSCDENKYFQVTCKMWLKLLGVIPIQLVTKYVPTIDETALERDNDNRVIRYKNDPAYIVAECRDDRAQAVSDTWKFCENPRCITCLEDIGHALHFDYAQKVCHFPMATPKMIVCTLEKACPLYECGWKVVLDHDATKVVGHADGTHMHIDSTHVHKFPDLFPKK
mgnify:CR=1 FL=1